MCDKYTSKKTSLTPASCFAKTMDKSHRVYQKCWWDPKKVLLWRRILTNVWDVKKHAT